MPIRFHSEVTGDVIMLNDVGTRFIHMLGYSGTIPGAIEAEQLPIALDNLNQALERAARVAGAKSSPTDNEDGEPKIGLQVRAVPLIEMIERIIAENSWLAWE